MASTYTGLGTELMTTGENASTWGTKTNTNLNIIEQIAGGYIEKSIAGGAQTTTLSVSDGSTGAEFSHRILKFTGTITGNQVVTIPLDVQQMYILVNGTSGAYTVQFKYASGSGSSLTFATTDKGSKIVYATADDGTNPNLVDTGISTNTLTGVTGDITIDSPDDLVLDAAGGNIEFKDAGTTQLLLDMDTTANEQIIQLKVDSDDLVFKQYDGNEVIRINDDRKLYFYDDGGEHISSDGTDFTFASGNDIVLDATADIIIDAAGGNIEFKDAGTTQLLLDMDTTAGDQIIQLKVDTDDLVFQQYDGNEVLRISDSNFVSIGGNSTSQGIVRFLEDSSNGSNYIAIQSPAANAAGADYTLTLPEVTAELIPGKFAGTNFTGSMLIGHATTGTLSAAQYNLGVGVAALDAITSGDQNTAVGYNAGSVVSSSYYNTLLGTSAGAALSTSGSYDNVAVGRRALITASSGAQKNTVVGSLAGEAIAAGDFNTALGYNSGADVNSGSYNTTIGYQAGDNLTTGSGNILLGTGDFAAADSARTFKVVSYDGSSTTNHIISDSSGNMTLAGNLSSSSGTSTNPILTLTNTNTDANGSILKFVKDAGEAGAANDVSGLISFYCDDAGQAQTEFARIQGNVIDATAGGEEGSLDFHVAEYDGTLTKGMSITGLSSDGNITVDISTHDGSAGGLKLGGTLVTATAAELNLLDGSIVIPGKVEGTNFTDSLLVGHSTTGTLNAAQQNTGVGIDALDAITDGDQNTAIGFGAGTAITGAYYNTLVGTNAGSSLSTSGSNENTAIGRGALSTATSGARLNVVVGAKAGAAITSGDRNTALGFEAANDINSGAYNLTLGYQAGDNLTTGSGNVIIGSIDGASATASRQLMITGYDGTTTTTWIQGDSDGNVEVSTKMNPSLTTTGKALVLGF